MTNGAHRKVVTVPLLDQAALRADARSDEAGAALARCLAAQVRCWILEASSDEAEQLFRAALPLLEAKQDHSGLADVWVSLANGVYNLRCRYDELVHAAEMARQHETLAARPHRSDSLWAMGLVYGPRPVGEALRRLDDLDPTVWIEMARAILLAMADRFDESRALVQATEARVLEMGGSTHMDFAQIDGLAGAHGPAAERIRLECDLLIDHGTRAGLGTYFALLGRELCALGRYDEAERRIAGAEALGQADDPLAQALWRQVAALVAAHRGDHGHAERLAQEALPHLSKTDSPMFQADGFCDLAEVLETAGRREEAVAAWQEALDRYERKGVVPLARRVRERLAALEPA